MFLILEAGLETIVHGVGVLWVDLLAPVVPLRLPLESATSGTYLQECEGPALQLGTARQGADQ